MKKLPLSNGEFSLLDDDVYQEMADWGFAQVKWCKSYYGYAVTNVHGPNGKRGILYLHQLVVGKAPKGKDTDHINQNKLDNRRENLRFVSRRLNNLNSSKKKWIIRHQDKWRVRFLFEGMEISVTGIDTEEQARSIAALLRGSLMYYELTKGG